MQTLRRSDSVHIMVEAGAILFVVVVSLGVYLSSWVAARQFSEANAGSQLDALRQHRVTLQEKILRGTRENWDHVMMDQLEHRLHEVDREITKTLGTSNRA